MKKRFFTILLVLTMLTLIASYFVYSYRSSKIESQKINDEYSSYYNKQMLGTELISIINRTIDINQKNEIDRDNNNYYIDNGENSIKVYVNFIYKNDIKTITMEDIEKSGTEEFVKRYSTASFKCTNVEYHDKSKNVKSITFDEISENN